ncbi:MAG: leucine-rich repeat domain-containing protein [Clostridia bacterium]|nr:leucine-rich repeat domain-containing protein [Clostridia bacterium]
METVKYGPLTLELVEDSYATGYCVVGCNKDVLEVEIPLRVGEYNVVSIGDYAFEGCERLGRVHFPKLDPEEHGEDAGLREIGEYAFSGCTSLVVISIPDTVTTVSRGAFYGCVALIAAEFSLSTYIAPYAFSGCRTLRFIPPLGSISEGTFRDCFYLDCVTLTEHCCEIGEDAFEHCRSLYCVIIPESVRRIDGLAFRGCLALRRVAFAERDGWYECNSYTGTEEELELIDAAWNAHRLSGMDFDDGVIAWYRKE